MHTATINFEPAKVDLDPRVSARNATSRRISLVRRLQTARKAYKNAETKQDKAQAKIEVRRLTLEWRFLQKAVRDGRPINPVASGHRTAV